MPTLALWRACAPACWRVTGGARKRASQAFYVSADKAKDLLGFSPKHDLKDDISWYYSDNYVAQGGEEKDVDFSVDESILKVAA